MQKNYEGLVRGNSYTYNFKFSTLSSGLPIDITNYKIYFTLKAREDMTDEEAVISKDITPTAPTDGIVSFTLSNTDTASLSGRYYYDITFQSPVGVRKTMLIGTMTYDKSITIRTT
jgi:hypothetical protein